MKKLQKLSLSELKNSAVVMSSEEERRLVVGGGVLVSSKMMDWGPGGSGAGIQLSSTYFGGSLTNMLPEVNVTIDGPNTTLMSFNSFVNSCKSSYNQVFTDALTDIATKVLPAFEIAKSAASTFDNVSGIANNNTNLEIIRNIGNMGYAKGDSVNLSVTRTVNNITVYTTSGDSIYSSYGK